jgi:hypothetical protein
MNTPRERLWLIRGNKPPDFIALLMKMLMNKGFFTVDDVEPRFAQLRFDRVQRAEAVNNNEAATRAERLPNMGQYGFRLA